MTLNTLNVLDLFITYVPFWNKDSFYWSNRLRVGSRSVFWIQHSLISHIWSTGRSVQGTDNGNYMSLYAGGAAIYLIDFIYSRQDKADLKPFLGMGRDKKPWNRKSIFLPWLITVFKDTFCFFPPRVTGCKRIHSCLPWRDVSPPGRSNPAFASDHISSSASDWSRRPSRQMSRAVMFDIWERAIGICLSGKLTLLLHVPS